MEKYLVVTIKYWNIDNFYKYTKNFKGKWHLISEKEGFSLTNVDKIKPKKIFFVHWSWIIPKEIFEKYECVVFHITDLPFGRGGSPLQNLIVRGIYETKISALRVVQELDAGDIYLKKPLNIEYGTAEEIFRNASEIIYQMIEEIIEGELKPKPQEGAITKFMRRKPEESNLKGLNDIRKVYDCIRMLDGEGYPKAFLEIERMRYEFFQPKLDNGTLKAKVIIKKKDDVNNEE
ncbi:MAG: methionyl-tRNA formyltransferase [Promethearchaeota archaeon]